MKKQAIPLPIDQRARHPKLEKAVATSCLTGKWALNAVHGTTVLDEESQKLSIPYLVDVTEEKRKIHYTLKIQ